MPRKISPAVARTAGKAINAAVQREALHGERVGFWAEQVLAAGSDDAARDVIATIDLLEGLRGSGPGRSAEDERQLESDRAALYDRGQIAAASGQAWGQADDEGAISALFPPEAPLGPPARQRVTASRRPPRSDEGSPDEELHAALFADGYFDVREEQSS
jgi:hypothetical protein